MAKRQKPWTEKENRILISAIKGGNTATEIAEYLGRSKKSVQEHCRKMHLDVSELKQKKDVRAFSLAEVTCPYFVRMYRGKSIKCEGLIPSGYMIVGYGTPEQMQKHATVFCKKDYNKCPLYQLLFKVQKEREKRGLKT